MHLDEDDGEKQRTPSSDATLSPRGAYDIQATDEGGSQEENSIRDIKGEVSEDDSKRNSKKNSKKDDRQSRKYITSNKKDEEVEENDENSDIVSSIDSKSTGDSELDEDLKDSSTNASDQLNEIRYHPNEQGFVEAQITSAVENETGATIQVQNGLTESVEEGAVKEKDHVVAVLTEEHTADPVRTRDLTDQRAERFVTSKSLIREGEKLSKEELNKNQKIKKYHLKCMELTKQNDTKDKQLDELKTKLNAAEESVTMKLAALKETCDKNTIMKRP